MKKPSNVRELFSFFYLIIPRVGSFLTVFLCFLLVVFLNSANMVSVTIRHAGNEVAVVVLDSYKMIFDLVPDFPYLVGKYADVANENSKLKSENYELTNKVKDLSVELAEQQALTRELNFSSPLKYKTSAFRISSIDISGAKHYISAISDDNPKVHIDSAVIHNDLLIGKLVAIDGDILRVQLITDVNFKVSGITLNSQKRCVVKGRGLPKKLQATCLDSDPRYFEGVEKIITAGNDGVFPYGIVIGEISASSDAFHVETEISVKDLRFMQIVEK